MKVLPGNLAETNVWFSNLGALWLRAVAVGTSAFPVIYFHVNAEDAGLKGKSLLEIK